MKQFIYYLPLPILWVIALSFIAAAQEAALFLTNGNWLLAD